MSQSGASGPDQSPGGDETFTSVEIIVARFRGQWRGGLRPSIAACLPPADQPHRRAVLEGLIATELDERLRAGQPARIEDYLDRFPELGTAADLPCGLIAAEYHARRNQGQPVALEEYAGRFPAQIAQLRAEVFAAGKAPADDAAEAVRIPASTGGQRGTVPFLWPPAPEIGTVPPAAPIDLQCGTVLGDFEIVRLLGTGSYSQVYLARQRGLDRQVALKVSGELGEEGKALARLDHPHIVPVFSQQVIAGRRVLAMRYVPGKTLAEWIRRRSDLDARRWRGRDLLAWLSDAAAAPRDAAAAAGGEPLASLRFAPAMCRIVLGLAEALQHAHQQGVLHRDVKPANVLLDLSGRAMLMDFNVSARQTDTAGGRGSLLGGTLAYMAPEHLAALLPDVPGAEAEVDRRSDVYSLGVVFYELLAGRHPWPHVEASSATEATIRQVMAARLQGPPPLPPGLPGVSPGLRSIVEKCLAPQQETRYQSAAELADDLRRWLDNRPLAAAPDPSGRERAAKWVRRHPRAVTAAATAAVIAAVLAVYAGWCDVRRWDRAEGQLAAAARLADADRSGEAARMVVAAQAAISRSNLIVPERFTAARRRKLADRLAAVAAEVAGLELGRFERQADASRAAAFGLAGPDRSLAADPLEVYGVLDRPDWQRLPQYVRLDPRQRAWVDEDVTELLLTRTVSLGAEPGDSAGASPGRAERMFDLLDRVPAAHRDAAPVNALLDQLRRKPDGPIDVRMLAAGASGEFDCYLAGAIAAQQGQFALAVDCLAGALGQRPPDRPPRFWARFLHAYCCERLGQDEAAIADYGICIGLREDFAWSYHNLGLIYTKRGNYALAEENLREALRRAPDLPEAHANLGVALFLMGRFADARDALDQAIALGDQTADVLSNRAAAREALGDRQGAREDLRRALEIDPGCKAARENLQRLEGPRQPPAAQPASGRSE